MKIEKFHLGKRVLIKYPYGIFDRKIIELSTFCVKLEDEEKTTHWQEQSKIDIIEVLND